MTPLNFIRQNIRTIAIITPLVAFFLLGALIPYQNPSADVPSGSVDVNRFLVLVVTRVLVIGAMLALFWRIYVADFPLKIDRWGCVVGLIGGVLWIATCSLGVEKGIVSSLGISESILGTRSSVDPFAAYPSAATRTIFLAFRFTLLVIIVPVAEELFLRGFLMRVVDSDQWSEQPLNQIGNVGLASGTIYGVLTHPNEFVAAALWFSLVSLLMLRTGRFWNCVLAHAITNLMLGLYVCYTGSWRLW